MVSSELSGVKFWWLLHELHFTEQLSMKKATNKMRTNNSSMEHELNQISLFFFKDESETQICTTNIWVDYDSSSVQEWKAKSKNLFCDLFHSCSTSISFQVFHHKFLSRKKSSKLFHPQSNQCDERTEDECKMHALITKRKSLQINHGKNFGQNFEPHSTTHPLLCY